jgi:hypothetical protein
MIMASPFVHSTMDCSRLVEIACIDHMDIRPPAVKAGVVLNFSTETDSLNVAYEQ